MSMEPEVRFRFIGYGIDVPLVKPYICERMSQLLDPTAKPLRADARRNREKVLEAARAVFAEHGGEAAPVPGRLAAPPGDPARRPASRRGNEHASRLNANT